MWPFRKPRATEVPFNELIAESAQVNNQFEVVETTDALQIPRDRLIVVGSGVLALLGLSRRADDLDIVLHPETLEELRGSGELPSGLPVGQAVFSRPEHPHFTAATKPLSTELFPHNSPSLESFEKMSERDTIKLGDIEGLTLGANVPADLRVIRPGVFEAKVESHLRRGIYTGSDSERRREYMQDLYDHILIREFMDLQ